MDEEGNDMARTNVRKTKSKPVSKASAQQYYDYNLLASVVLLTCFGLIMLYSTSAYDAQVNYNNDMYFFGKQAIISAVCLVGVVIASQVDYHFYAKFAGLLYVVSNFLLFITKFVGIEVNGAKRWLGTGSLSFQPAEIAKVAIILFIPV